MATVIVTHEVADYDAWRKVFDEIAQLRMDGGERSASIYRSADNGNGVTGVFEWDSLDNAHSYFENPDLRAAMERAGVVSAPDIQFLESA